MRGFGFTRDFHKSMLAVMPSRGMCLHVLESAAPEPPAESESLVRSLLPYSHAEQIMLDADPAIPPAAVFGPEPEHTWCWYYQAAALARQLGDWQAIAMLDDEVEALGLRPRDRSEWMPFFQAYLNLGMDGAAREVADRIRDREATRHLLCDHLTRTYFADEDAFRRGEELLCSFQ